jgi:hypothetical protein
VQHLQDLGRLKLDQPTFEVMIRVGAGVELFDSSLSLQQDLDGLLDLFDLSIGLETRISDASEQTAATRVASNEEETHTTRSGIGPQNFGELGCVDEGQLELGNDDFGPIRQREFETGGTMRRHSAGMSCELERVRDALAAAGIAICDEDRCGRHVDFVRPPKPR